MSPHIDNENNAMRLFIGTRISMETLRGLTELVHSMDAVAQREQLPIRWVQPATYHITLHFLGWTRRETVGAINDAIAACLAKYAAASFLSQNIGAFPAVNNARLIWAGVSSGATFLEQLAASIGETLAPLGFPLSRRPFHPHVTLGRLATPTNVESMIASEAEHMFSKTLVESITLFESAMKTTGSEYTPLLEWPLCPPKNSSIRHRGKLKPNHSPTESRSQS